MHSSLRTRSSSKRRRLELDILEVRNLLSGAGIASVSPAPGAVLTQQPSQIVVTFNRNDIPFWISVSDLQIEQLNSNGTMTPVWNAQNGLAPVEYTDPTGTQLIVPMESQSLLTGSIQNLTLQPGSYQIDLTAFSGVSYAASGMADGLTPLWNPFADYAIGTFTILGQGATLAGATNLGSVGSSIETVSGSITPTNYQQAVDLYQINLAPGHAWQLGLNVASEAIGSAFQPALSLFDAQGNVIKTRDAGTGTAAYPNDPYLFAGLPSGTYYVGVSGAGNLPTLAGGYNPVTGTPGLIGQNQPGGPFSFNLDLVATPHDQPTQVTSLHVDHLDPLSPDPTSVTIKFSGAIGASNVFVVDAQQHALELYDSSGGYWATTAESYNAQTATLQLIIDEPLPAGSYTLISPVHGGLADLTGAAVTAPGEPAGVLGSFTVAPAAATPPGDLGVLWPSQAAKVWPTAAESFVEQTTLAPNAQETYRFVVTIPGLYKLQTVTSGGSLTLMLFGNGKVIPLSSGAGGLANNPLNLEPGAYQLRFVNSGASTMTVNWALKYASLDWEKIVDNGVGQYYSLSLGLVSSDAAAGGASSSSALVALAGPGAFLGGFASGPITGSLFTTQNSSLLGGPSVSTESIAVVGPTVESGSIAIADAATGLLPGVRYESSPELAEIESATVATATNPPPADSKVAPAAVVDSESFRHRADILALANARWMTSLGAMVEDWFTPVDSSDRPLLDRAAVAQVLDGPPALAPAERTRNASVDPAALTGLILTAAAVYRASGLRSRRKRLVVAPFAGEGARSIPAPHSSMSRVSKTSVCIKG